MSSRFSLRASILLAAFTAPLTWGADPFEIKDGDRVLLMGDTLIEREGNYGYLETRMHEQFPQRHFVVRNLGFSADVPLGWSRASFDPAAKGIDRIKEQLDLVKPTVAFLGYGMAASLEEMTYRSGDPGLNPDVARYGLDHSVAKFKADLAQLMDLIVAASPGKNVRFVLLSPIRHEDLRTTRPGTPDPAEHNKLLAAYSQAIEELAKERGARFVAGGKLEATVDKDAATSAVVTKPITDNGIHLTENGYRRFAIADFSDQLGWQTPAKPDDFATLRAAVQRKNLLFFHRWRPANHTYLLGFRKHEQGKNAAEIPKFDPLIDAADAEIDKLKAHLGESVAASAQNPSTNATNSAAKPAIAAAPVFPQVKTAPPEPLRPLPQFTLADGLEMTLFAENPLLEKPIQMNWDQLGRLWIASSNTYPQVNPEDIAESLAGKAAKPTPSTGDDKIIVLEDTDHDGKANKSTVFADGLLIPTAVAPDLASKPGKDAGILNACYVGASTELLHLADTDGDGKADDRRIVLSGFGTEDTHHIVHTLHWGPDGRLYFHQSIYIHSHIETPWGVVRANAGAVFAYDPRTERVEVTAKGLWNSWGQQEDQWGQTFLTDGAGGDGVSWAFPGAVFAPSEGARRTTHSISPGRYPKFAGLELIHSPAFPADWQGNAITCDFRAHRIVRFGFEDLAARAEAPTSGYVTKEMPDVVRTSDVSFRPIDVRLGPDGALYVADWSNPVINHGEVDFRDPRRDKFSGRIWRITAKGQPISKWEPLAGKATPELLEKLLSANRWEKEQATRVIAGRMIEEQKTESYVLGGRHAAYLMDFLLGHIVPVKSLKGGTAPSVEMIAAAHRSELAQLSIYRILQTTGRSHEWVSALVFNAFDSQAAAAAMRLVFPERDLTWPERTRNPRILLEAVRGLGRTYMPRDVNERDDELQKEWAKENPSLLKGAILPVTPPRMSPAQRADLILDAALALAEQKAKGVTDDFLDFAVWQSMNDLAKPWADAVLSGAWKADGREKQLEYALNAIDPLIAAPVINALLKDRALARDGSGPWIELIAKGGDATQLRRLFDAALTGALDPQPQLRALNALLDAARVRSARPDGDLAGIGRLFDEQSRDLRAAAARLAGAWHLGAFAPRVTELASLEKDAGLRGAGFEGLRAMGGQQAVDALRSLIAADRPLVVRRAALAPLATHDLDSAIAALPSLFGAITSESEALESWRALFAIAGVFDKLEKSYPNDLPPVANVTALKAAREKGHNGALLADLIAPLVGKGGGPRDVRGEIAGLVGAVKQGGDPSEGEMIYRRIGCVACHAIGGAGGKLGPDLTSLGASAPLDYAIESVLDPAAKVKEGYHAFSFTMKDGSQLTGIPTRETATEQFIRPGPAPEIPLVKANIAKRENIGSLMPPGLIDGLNFVQKRSLFAFLGELGKPGAFDASKGNVARVWWLTPDAAAAKSGKLDQATAAQTLVDGRLTRDLASPFTTILHASAESAAPVHVYATARFEAPSATTKPLNLTGAKTAWLDGQPLTLDAAGNSTAPIPAGAHILTVQLDAKALPEALRAQCDDARFLGE